MTSLWCQVCQQGLTDENKHVVREMMFGVREPFDYYECPRCGCLQLRSVPADMSRYYPASYPAFRQTFNPVRSSILSRLKGWSNRQHTLYQLGRFNPVGFLRGLLSPPPPSLKEVHLADTGITLASTVLDVGCGNGELLSRMARAGFENLTGADPYAEAQSVSPSLKIIHCHLNDIEGKFDLVMLHHSFEHMPEPKQTIKRLSNLLGPGGRLMIRIPLMGKYAWKQYGTDWAQIDAPRHLFLHTERSMQLLAEYADLEISKIIYDSYNFQFWGSELYRRDIPLSDPRAVWASPPDGPFTPEEMTAWKEKSDALNQRQDGDQACFILQRK